MWVTRERTLCGSDVFEPRRPLRGFEKCRIFAVRFVPTRTSLSVASAIVLHIPSRARDSDRTLTRRGCEAGDEREACARTT